MVSYFIVKNTGGGDMSEDRFKWFYESAMVLVECGRRRQAVLLAEETREKMPKPSGDEPRDCYRALGELIDFLRPEGAERWVCEKSYSGFCHSQNGMHCLFCGEMIERL
ncbi:MAG: hypothetical protein COX80_05265 [Candidatus Magasanikbacteria bacterium CG_4_10_14_0_2_um_filter_33_14]|uniref:Uncharacterized protein n=1 Tax=Candidatus Magasanikbacteria bacterium CG_4_10_14_0_2_um_filter_33_14 TaxID=1974636 RepID=A0A2M7V7Y9_9BACT|nr:MAG: hypothetical protein COX80_05265 [Candidatus Magasanikbacteria bacterium CG_4_10_14_0_2_um_filter_33_14]